MMVAMVATLALTGCTDYRDIPVSTVGKVVDNSGVSKETYQAGKRDIGHAFRYTKKLILLDQSVEIIPMKLDIRLADNQTLGVTLAVKLQLDISDKASIDSMFTLITPIKVNDDTMKIPLTLIYTKLGADLVQRTLVEVVTPESLESFQKDRKKINDTIESIIKERFKSTPLLLYSATITKVQYPQTYIDKANDIKDMQMNVEKTREQEIAKRAKLEEQEATIVIDQRVRLAQAETIRLENLKTTDGINPMLLEYRKLELERLRLEVDLEFAKNSGKSGNTVYYPVGQKPEYINTRLGQTK